MKKVRLYLPEIYLTGMFVFNWHKKCDIHVL